ncbi:1-acyl-sn-glycerol-3-phosphate acyltransferase [Catellatospora sp. TT07R-123]|uniref:lysophospholipid acyltransferase family protein n=1 Tax=Catellatospora sp. TT07R-123 TaxID=2733863 RepID=UPI001B23F4A3|nr:lysophospholipid acyltransferase family protein [Catellatospora sp. TT07R-123]GHJ48812.1 1-acyl-sn-glycerol-3-phosphate acyltransferase [Catellatospora sp. TT07R-123]
MSEPSLLGSLLRAGFDRMVRRDLRGVYLRGGLPAGPFVWAANHHSWWDPFVASAVLHRAGRPVCLLMLQENLDRYRFVRRLGVFGTAELATGLRLLKRGRTLVVFPEGELRPAAPPGPLSPGAAWYAARTGTPLLAVAVRVVLRGQDRPEAYVSCTEVPVKADVDHTTELLTEVLAEDLANLDGQLAVADPRTPLAGFRRVVAGRSSWDERIDRARAVLPWRS